MDSCKIRSDRDLLLVPRMAVWVGACRRRWLDASMRPLNMMPQSPPRG